jgi:hypothetical protein
MKFTTMDNLLWAAGFIGHAALLVVMVVRRRVRKFPVFTSLLAYQALKTVTLFLIWRYRSAHAYYLSYWILAPGDYAFQIALILEIARNVLRPTGTWVRDARISFLLWATIGMLVAAGMSLAVTPPGFAGLDLWSVRATVFTSLLTCEVFLAMSAAANRVGLLWGSHVMALGEGLTVWALIALLGNVVHFALGWNRDFVLFDHVVMFVYLGSLVFWMVAFWRPERQRAPLSAEMQEYLLALHRRVEYDLDRIKTVGRPPL